VSGGEIAALVAALAFTALVAVLSTVLLRGHRLLTEAERLVVDIHRSAIPLIEDVRVTLHGVNQELDRVDTILASVSSVSSGVSGVANLVTTAATNPLVKGLSFLAGARASVKSFKDKGPTE
jgi:uncharacterized protein YoxC